MKMHGCATPQCTSVHKSKKREPHRECHAENVFTPEHFCLAIELQRTRKALEGLTQGDKELRGLESGNRVQVVATSILTGPTGVWLAQAQAHAVAEIAERSG